MKKMWDSIWKHKKIIIIFVLLCFVAGAGEMRCFGIEGKDILSRKGKFADNVAGKIIVVIFRRELRGCNGLNP